MKITGRNSKPHELNTPEILKQISIEYWQDKIPDNKLLKRLGLSHRHVIHDYHETCTRCGNTDYVLRSPGAHTFQCTKCRQIISMREVKDIKSGILPVEVVELIGGKNV